MKRLKELSFIKTKPGASGEFHYILLVNPNAAMELMRSKKLVQDEVYARFNDRLMDMGAYSEVQDIRNILKSVEGEKIIAEAII